jgi:hypothetical protein
MTLQTNQNYKLTYVSQMISKTSNELIRELS